MDGERRPRAITISPEAMAGDPEDLQDLILAAANEAFAKADEARTGAVSGMFPGLTP
jgi:DNA-binding protein YbaB